MPYGTVNADLMTTSDGVSSSGLYGFKNRIINGAMVIDQRNAGAAVTGDGDFPVDRYKIQYSMDGAISLQQDSSAPTGFINSTKITVTTADASLGTSQFAIFRHFIEGTNISDLAWGTASAATVTLSFWVRSSLTGTFGGSLNNSANTRSYPFTYTISVANTWEQKIVTIAGDTSGTWLTTTGVGIRINWSLGAGTDFLAAAGSWVSAEELGATGQTNVLGTLNATWYITGVQLEKGSTATSFDYRPIGTELALCQRYFEKSFDIDQAVANGPNTTSFISNNGVFSYVANNNAGFGGTIKFAVSKRAVPTITGYGNSLGYWGYVTQASSNSVIYDAGAVSTGRIGTGGFSGGQAVVNNALISVLGHWTASAEL